MSTGNQFHFIQAIFEAFAAAFERLIASGLEARRRCSWVRVNPIVPLRLPSRLSARFISLRT